MKKENYIIHSRYGNAGISTIEVECNTLKFSKRGKIKEVTADNATIKLRGYVMGIELKGEYIYTNHTV